MSYLTDDKSAHGGRPRELYAFTGTFLNYYYTSGPVPVDFGGHTYVPIPIKRSEVAAGSQDDDGLALQIDVPATLEMVQVYAFQVAPPFLKLTIYRYHDISEWVPYWQGLVGQVNVGKGTATLRSPSILELILTGNIPNAFYQTPCNHVLFDQLCKVPEADWTQIATVTAIDGRTISVTTIGTLDTQLVGGEAVLGSGESRMIVTQSGTDITVNYPYASVEIGDAITVTAGCDLKWDGDCINKFNNGDNFGGFAFIPPDNIFANGMKPGKSVPDHTCLASCDDEPPPDEWRVDFPFSVTVFVPDPLPDCYPGGFGVSGCVFSYHWQVRAFDDLGNGGGFSTGGNWSTDGTYNDLVTSVTMGGVTVTCTFTPAPGAFTFTFTSSVPNLQNQSTSGVDYTLHGDLQSGSCFTGYITGAVDDEGNDILFYKDSFHQLEPGPLGPASGGSLHDLGFTIRLDQLANGTP
jgi:uncharacterized phage protein (TIGR02218 family)